MGGNVQCSRHHVFPWGVRAIRELIAVFRRDVLGLIASHRLLKMWWLFVAALAVPTLLAWPASYSLAQAAWPKSVAWWAYATTIGVGYFALAHAAQVFRIETHIPLRDWVLYGNVRLLPFIAGKLLSSALLTLGWLLLA